MPDDHIKEWLELNAALRSSAPKPPLDMTLPPFIGRLTEGVEVVLSNNAPKGEIEQMIELIPTLGKLFIHPDDWALLEAKMKGQVDNG